MSQMLEEIKKSAKEAYYGEKDPLDILNCTIQYIERLETDIDSLKSGTELELYKSAAEYFSGQVQDMVDPDMKKFLVTTIEDYIKYVYQK